MPDTKKRYRVKRSEQQLRNGISADTHVLQDAGRMYFEGDMYDGRNARDHLRKGLLEEVSDGED